MSNRQWIFLINTFDVNTQGTNVRMLSLATDTDSKLEAKMSDADILLIYNAFHPVYDAYRLICINYEIASGNHQGETLNVQTMLTDDLPVDLRIWEGIVRSVYPEDTPQEKAIFPNKRTPFLQGTYESRITAIGALAGKLQTDPAFATLFPQVQSAYNLILTARDTQQQKEGLLDELSALRENQRVLVAQEMWGTVLAGLMKRYKTDPEQIKNYFDLSLLRETGEDENPPSPPQVFEGTVVPLVTVHIDTAPVVIATDTEIEMQNPGTVPLNYYFASMINGFPAPGAIEIIVPPGGTNKMQAQAMGFSPTSSFLHVRNTNSAGTGNWRVEI